jgi:hypothetical protein
MRPLPKAGAAGTAEHPTRLLTSRPRRPNWRTHR